MTVGVPEVVAQSTDAPCTGTQRWPSQDETSTEAGRVWVTSTVNEASTRWQVRAFAQVTETQSEGRAPSKAGSSAVADLWNALDQPVAGFPSSIAAGSVSCAPE